MQLAHMLAWLGAMATPQRQHGIIVVVTDGLNVAASMTTKVFPRSKLRHAVISNTALLCSFTAQHVRWTHAPPYNFSMKCKLFYARRKLATATRTDDIAP
jgi:hypothetical protein